VTFLAQRTRQKVEDKAKRPGYLSMEEWARHRQMIDRGVTALESYVERLSEQGRSRLWTLLQEIVEEQNEHRRVYGGPVRVIRNKDLLLVEYALRTVLADHGGIPVWAYQTAHCYAERSDASHAGDLTPASAPPLQDIADFWIKELGLGAEAITMPTKASKPKEKKKPQAPGKQKVRFTERQGQFLAFIHLYRKLHRQGPAELDIVRYFRLTPPSVHGMVVKLGQLGLVTREAGVPRSVRVAVPESEIPTGRRRWAALVTSGAPPQRTTHAPTSSSSRYPGKESSHGSPSHDQQRNRGWAMIAPWSVGSVSSLSAEDQRPVPKSAYWKWPRWCCRALPVFL
jgi:repressor LexA